MDNKDRLNLSKLIKEYDVEETTDEIRRIKASEQIREQVGIIEHMKKKYARLRKSNPSQFESMILSKASFLYNNYTDIYNRLMKDDLDLNILWQFLEILKKIEDGDLDQHEGSYHVGMLLKKLYVDSALKKEEKMKAKDKRIKEKEQEEIMKPVRNIGWAEYKMHLMD